MSNNTPIFDRVYEYLSYRRDRIDENKVNCIPFGLPRFEEILPGVEQGKMYGVTATPKVGKTQIGDKLFLYSPLMYAFENRDKVRVKIFYFTLEMSQEQKYQQFISFLLYMLSQGRIRISPTDLRSTPVDKPLPREILDLINTDRYKEYFEFFERSVTFIDSIRNPFGIYYIMRQYASVNGIQHKKEVDFVNNSTGKIETSKEIDDYYEPHDPDEYVIFIVDHLSLITPEKGESLRESMVKLSSEYCVRLRNKYKYIPVLIQQQALSQESNENYKLNKLRPTIDGLGEAKVTSRDFDVLMGLFSPERYGIPVYEGYDIKKFRDNIRFLEIMASREGGGGTLCPLYFGGYRDWETDRKSTRLNSSHSAKSRMPSSA